MSKRFGINIIVTIYIWLITFISLTITYLIILVGSPILDSSQNRYIFENIGIKFIYMCVKLANIWKIRIIDQRKFKEKNTQYIIISNHISLIDGLLLLYIHKNKIGYVAKKFGTIPILSGILKSCNYTLIAKEDPSTTNGVVNNTISLLNKDPKLSLFLFPEGKRNSNPNQMLKFKTGGFRISMETNIPILPVTIIGSDKAHSIGSWLFNPSKIKIIIGKPIFPSKYNKLQTFIKNVKISISDNYKNFNI